jgi:hypothetical protein
MNSEPLLTRAQIVARVKADLGIPISVSTIEKAGMNGTGPEPAAKYGRSFLYTWDSAAAWARGLITPVEKSSA